MGILDLLFPKITCAQKDVCYLMELTDKSPLSGTCITIDFNRPAYGIIELVKRLTIEQKSRLGSGDVETMDVIRPGMQNRQNT